MNELEVREQVRRWKGLLNLGSPRKYERHAQLFVQGDPLHQVFLIEQGFTKLDCHTRVGRTASLLLRFPGDWTGLCCAALESSYFLSATTLTQSLIHAVDVQRLLDVSANVPDAAKLLRATLSNDVRRTMTALLGLKVHSGRERFEGLLADLISISARKMPRGRVEVRLPATDAEIAELISVTPEHLSRIKRELKAEGRFESKGRVVQFATARTQDRGPRIP